MKTPTLLCILALVSFACSAEDPQRRNNFTGGGGDTLSGDSDGGDSTLEGTVTLATTCPSFTPCGGNLAGTWRYSEVCYTEDEVFALVYDACPTATVSNVVPGAFHGTVTFTAPNTVDRDVVISVSGTVHLPAACAFGQCGIMQNTLNSFEGVSGTCVAGASAGSCDCNATVNYDQSDTGTYSVSGNDVTIVGSQSTNIFEYCVDGSTLDYRDVSAQNALPGVFTLVR